MQRTNLVPGLLLAAVLSPLPAPAAEPARDEVLTAMKKASRFMRESVAVRGGHGNRRP